MKKNTQKENEIVKATNAGAISYSNVQQRIICVRDKAVIIDADVAALYGVEAKYLNRQVKRNIERFPVDFMFQLSKEECLR